MGVCRYQHSGAPHVESPFPMILVAMLFLIFMAFAYPFSYLSAMLEPTPHDLAVEVISTTEEAPQIAQQLRFEGEGALEVTTVADVEQVAEQTGMELTTEDLVPLEDSDPSGSASTYLALGVILGGFMSGIIRSLLPAGSTVRVALGLIMPAEFAIFSGIVLTAWLMMYLLCATALAVITGLLLLLGPVALPLAILLIPMLGMSSSGVSAPLDMVGGFYGAMHTWVFSAQGIGAVRDALCFEGTSLTAPVLIMLGRLVGGVLLALAGTVQQKRRRLFAQLTAKEEAEVAVATGAAAV